ncbi:MAG TPA: DUF3732 domain-containing protein [Phycisphaerae bacterium]|nr:DUF3732 domain-containing protein [Phycisphaerae bacterium]
MNHVIYQRNRGKTKEGVTLNLMPFMFDPFFRPKDIAGVRRIFRALASAVERTNGRLQIIVTDHAGAITWQGLDVNVVADWRTGRGDFLIPDAWKKA